MNTDSAPPFLNRDEIIRALSVLHPGGRFFEIRVIDPRMHGRGYVPKSFFGYFSDPEVAVRELEALHLAGAQGVFVTLNEIMPALASHAFNRMKAAKTGAATADKHILRRRWLLVDCDPEREPKDISATNGEKEAAEERARLVYAHLQAAGFREPVVGDSANGVHLLYAIDLPAESDKVARVLGCLDAQFTDVVVKIDTSVASIARLSKVYGTTPEKGDHCPDPPICRPRRAARLLHVPRTVEVNPEEVLDAFLAKHEPNLAGHADRASEGESDADRRRLNAMWGRGLTSKDKVDAYLRDKFEDCDPGQPQAYVDGWRWVFGVCPFDAAHTDRSAAVILRGNGMLGFKCHHNGCQGKGWREARAKVDSEYNPDRRGETSPENGKSGGRPGAPPASDTAAQYADDKLRMPNGYLVARHYRDAWYRFADGWHPVSDGEMEKHCITYMQDREDLCLFASPHYARNVLHNLASYNLCGIAATVEQPCWLSSGKDARNVVAFSNGIAVDVWTYAEQLAAGQTPTDYTSTVTPDLFSVDFVAYPWDETAQPNLFIHYLHRVLPQAEDREAIQRMMGLILADTGKYEVFWQLYGKGANGKTVLLDIIESLVGRWNVSRVALECLAPGTRFQTFPLVTSKVNISGELGTDLGRAALAAVEGQFKHAVSGGDIEVERKNADKFIDRCRARFILAGNSLPTFFDKSDAIWRRLRIIPFSVQIPEEERDPDLARRIIDTEMAGVCRWSLHGLARVIGEGRVEDCPSGRFIKEAHRAGCDHERTFLTEQYEAGSDNDRIRSGEVYEHYRDWMTGNGYRPLGASRFFTRVKDVYPASVKKYMVVGRSKTQGIAGIREREEPEVSGVSAPTSTHGNLIHHLNVKNH